MKFVALLILTGSLLVSSDQQKPIWPKVYALRPIYWPFLWTHPRQFGDSDVAPVESGDFDYVPGAGSVDGRNWQSMDNAKFGVQQRFGFSPFQPFYRTTVTVTSSVLTAVISTCIPANQFSTSNAQTSTNPCGRRRRATFEPIKPSEVERLVPTAVRQLEGDRDDVEVLSSSDGFFHPQGSVVGHYRGYRAFNAVFTYTSTSYIFNSTVIKKTVNLGNTQQLLCLPYGFTVC